MRLRIHSETKIVGTYEEILSDTAFGKDITVIQTSLSESERVLCRVELEESQSVQVQLLLHADNFLQRAIRKRQLFQGNIGLVRR